MVTIKKTKPMSIKRINKILEIMEENHSLQQETNGEIVMINNSAKQVQPNLLAHLSKK